MEKYWLRRTGARRVVVLVLGWAVDHRVVEHIAPEGYDVLCIYDHRTIGADYTLAADITVYPDRRLAAWSFGVWAAEQLFAGVDFNRAVAFNGTPLPVDELHGIEPRRMAVTLRGLRGGGMDAFLRRAWGEHYDRFRPILAPRPLDDNIHELETLAARAAEPYEPSIRWDAAVIGNDDAIFPPENMARYWGARAQRVPLPHYPFADAEFTLKAIENR